MDRKDQNNEKGTNAGGSRSPSGAPAFKPNAPTFNPSAPAFIPGASAAGADNPWRTAGPRRVATGASSDNKETTPSSNRTIAKVNSGNQGYTAVPQDPADGSGRRSPWGIPGSGVSTAGNYRRNQVVTPNSSRVATGASGGNLPTRLGSSHAAAGDSPGSYMANAISGDAPDAGRGTQVVISGSNRPAANAGQESAVATPGSRGRPTDIWGTNRGVAPPSGQISSPARGTPRIVAGSGSQADPVSRIPS